MSRPTSCPQPDRAGRADHRPAYGVGGDPRSSLLVALALGRARRGQARAGPTDSLPRGADSTPAPSCATELPEDDSSVAIVLFTADEGAASAPAARRQLEQSRPAQLGAARRRVLPSQGRHGRPRVVPVPARSAAALTDAVADLREQASPGAPDGVTAQVTGPAAI